MVSFKNHLLKKHWTRRVQTHVEASSAMDTNVNLEVMPKLPEKQDINQGGGNISCSILTCKQCNEYLHNPITLNCFHSLCKECFLSMRIQFKGSQENEKPFLECPSCQYVTQLEQTSTKDVDLEYSSSLLKNVIVLTLKDYRKDDDPKCVPCSNRNKTTTALYWCFDCIVYLCEDCFLFHTSMPLLAKHKTYHKEELVETPSLFSMAREICETHGLRLTLVCKTSESVCCDRCISISHVDNCKGSHVNINQSSCFVDKKLPVLKLSIKTSYEETTNLLRDLCKVEAKAEKSFKNWITESSKTSGNVKQTVLGKADQLLAESYKVSYYKLTEIDSKIETLKQKKLVLQNAQDIILASRSGSEVRYFLEKKKVENIIKGVKKIVDSTVQEEFKDVTVSLDISLQNVLALKNFGTCRKVQTLMQEKDNTDDTGKCENVRELEPFQSSNLLTTECSSTLSVSSTGYDERSQRNLRSFKFGSRIFSLLKTIEVEGTGKSHITGSDWKSENEIVVVDANLNKREFRIYNTRSGTLENTIHLDYKPFDVTVRSRKECTITCPREKKIIVYDLTSFTKSYDMDVFFNCYGVCHWSKGTIVAGNDRLEVYDINFQRVKTVKLDLENVRYVHAYDHNLIFYTDLDENHVFSTMADGKSRFRYSNADMKCSAGLILDENKNVYFCEKSSSYLHKLTKGGIFIEKIEVGSRPTALSLSKSGKQICIIRGGRHLKNEADIYVSN